MLVPAALALSLALQGPAAPDWGPAQAAGAPDTPAAGDHPTAWASRTEDGGEEWLELTFPEPVVPVAARVFESFRPGALRAVVAFDEDGGEHAAWSGADPLPPGASSGVSLVVLDVAVPVRRLRLVLDSPAVRGWNEIDAVGLHDLAGRLWWAEGAAASSTFARGPAPDRAPRRLPPVVGALDPAWRTPADGLLALLRERRAAGADPALIADLAEQVHLVQALVHGHPAGETFAGRWATTFGPMRLEVEGTRVTGRYAGGTIDGTLEDGRLVFAYAEGDVSGEGWFDLARGGRSFEGRWRPAGAERWRPWRGTRAAARDDGATWLVVLEAPWEEGLAEPEYAFGAMLDAIFAHRPGVNVRRRGFTDAASFEAWCRQLAWLDGPVVLMVATHATRAGLQCQGGTIPPERVAAALGDLPNLKLVHFSACEAMAGEFPRLVNEACGAHPGFAGVSGYDVSVDWMASAVVEFFYLDLVLNRNLEPAHAAAEVVRSLDFADDEAHAGSPVPAAHFRFAPARER